MYRRGWITGLVGMALLLSMGLALAQTRVDGYFRPDGTYVQPHYRTTPDSNPYNNYSYPGNYNPNTGRITGGSQERYLGEYYQPPPQPSGRGFSQPQPQPRTRR